MRTRQTHWIVAVTLMASPLLLADGQSMTATLANLTSNVDTVRANALGQLTRRGAAEHFAVCSPAATNQIKESLIAALEKENVAIPNADGGENEGESYANLIGCVASLRDTHGTHALVGAIDTGWGAINGILNLGDAAVPAVVAVLTEPNSRTTAREAAAGTLGSFLSLSGPKPVSANSRTMIRAALLKAVTGKSMLVRSTAIKSLAPFRDLEVRQVITAAAESDTGMKIGSEPRRFPVRNAAQTWMRQDSLKIKK